MDGDDYDSAVWRIYFPYCLDRMEDNGERWVLLNRKYKPVGFYPPGNPWVDYEKQNWSFRFVRTPTYKVFQKLSWEPLKVSTVPEITRVCFYNDGCRPDYSKEAAARYLKRLEILMKLSIKI